MGMIVRGQLMLWGRENVEVTPDPVDNSGPIFDDEPMHSNDIYLTEQGDSNITIDLLDICYDRAQNDQDETDDLDQEPHRDSSISSWTMGAQSHMTRNLTSNLILWRKKFFWGTVKFGNDQLALILGYGDLVQGMITIKRVYFVEGLIHNLFSVGQFCDADLEVAFRKSTCYIRLFGWEIIFSQVSRGTDSIFHFLCKTQQLQSPICLLANVTSLSMLLVGKGPGGTSSSFSFKLRHNQLLQRIIFDWLPD
ncbi:hypothetical protein Tco_0893309 [Tanacetum coccineum]|uniref:Integrase, catalytic region, zinc finger, CCHC-type, peptidase aspartic, catalytic n=1 Tax=Tanacetum coccineum TaxID=301880 RepID=A0ABQ5CB59_9ASTR